MGVHFLSQYRNPLAYPAGYAPGVNPFHPAAKGLRFSGVAMAGGFVDVSTGAVGTIIGTPEATVDETIGPAAVLVNAGSDAFSWTGRNNAALAGGTMAAIVVLTSTGVNQRIVTNGTTSTCMSLYIAGTAFYYEQYGNDARDSGLTVSANVPYFLAFSTGATCNFVVKNLLTGQTKFSAAAAIGVSTGNGTYYVGRGADGFGYNSANISSAMFSTARLSVTELIQWADDPWSFWYPNPGDNWIAAAAAGGFSPYWAAQNNNFVIGTGIQ